MFGLTPLAIKAIAILLLVLTVAGAIGAYTMHQRALGAEAEKERQHQVDQAFITKLQSGLDELNAKYEPLAQELDNANADNVNKQLEIARLSAANDSRQCLDSGAVNRLRALDGLQPGSPAGGATRRRQDPRRVHH